MPDRARFVSTVLRLGALIGIVLLALNVAGLFVPLRAPDITTQYTDFARAGTLSYAEALTRLDGLKEEPNSERVVVEATRVFHEGVAHVRGEDIEQNGLAHYRLVVSPWENWVLYLLDFIKPPYPEDGYHFCGYRRALERGVGWCEQKSMALTGYLKERGFETGVVSLGGHVIATAKVPDRGWYLLDPDYGGVMPFDLKTAEQTPREVLAHYWTPVAAERSLDSYFGPDSNSVAFGGPEVRYPKACRIEVLAYQLKWAVPIVLLLAAFLAWRVQWPPRAASSR
jgi:hypothetical protein